MARKFEHALLQAGWEDIHVLSQEEGLHALQYQDILDGLEPGQQWIDIHRLASKAGRSPSTVGDELRELAELDIIARSRAGVRLKHDLTVIEPLT